MKSKLLLPSLFSILLLSMFFSITFGHVRMAAAQTSTDWSEPVNLSNSGATTDPRMVIDSNGIIHVIWVDAVDGYKYVQSKDGVSWSKPVTVDFPFDPVKDSRPRLLADASGSIHFFWTRTIVEKDENDQQIQYNSLMYARTGSNFMSQPLSWSTVGDKLADSVLDFDVFADARSVIHLSFVGSLASDSEPAGIFYRRFDNRAWAPPERLYASQYFRTLKVEETHVRLAVAGSGRTAEIYAVWDDRPSKRIFLAKSLDGGVNWGNPVQLRGPEDVLGLAFPYNVNVSATGKNVLLTWQLGQPGALCSQYSQWSTDGAQSLSEPVQVSDELNSCPIGGMFVGRPPGYFLLSLDLFGDLSLAAWNGMEWSSLQPQVELSAFTNPFTLDNVILGCRQIDQRADRMYIVGCDGTGTGDIWFRSRKIGTLTDWFPPISTWAGPVSVSEISQEISANAAVADDKGGLHSMWIQYSAGGNGALTAAIQYSLWKDGKWSRPTNIITGLDGIPQKMIGTSDEQGNIMLAWVQGTNGDIYFSRAVGDMAYLASEWSPALRVPSLSELNTDPDLLTDSSGNIALVYAIPFNENRGIYLIQSDDLGRNWSQPSRILDAIGMGWDSVTGPKIELTEGGRLHLLVTRNSLRDGGQETSLYYLQSANGGNDWTSPEVVSETSVEWSEIVYLGDNVLQRLWQERKGGIYEVFSEFSVDAGVTWSSALKVSDSESEPAALALSKDAKGQLYMMQASQEEAGIVLREIHWDGSRWTAQEVKTVALDQALDRYLIASGITSDRVVHLILSLDYKTVDDPIENKIVEFSRVFDPLDGTVPPKNLFLPSPAPAGPEAIDRTSMPNLSLTPTQSSRLAGIQEESNGELRNKIGLGLVIGIVVLTLMFLRPFSGKKQR